MIPYFFLQTISFGPLTLQVWGICVCLGVLAGLLLILSLAKKKNLSKELIYDLFFWIFLGGLIGARLIHVFYYAWPVYANDWAEIFRFWNGGMSSLGGFLGAFTSLLIFEKKRKISFKEFAPYGDILSLGFWLAWGMGRIGCFLIHDHPGRLSNFFLAVNFSNGARLDLGLLEAILAFGILALSIWVYKKNATVKPGKVLRAGLITYFIIRFFLDFLRAKDLTMSDPRYLALTPMQWAIIGGVLVLTFVVFRSSIARKKQIVEKKN